MSTQNKGNKQRKEDRKKDHEIEQALSFNWTTAKRKVSIRDNFYYVVSKTDGKGTIGSTISIASLKLPKKEISKSRQTVEPEEDSNGHVKGSFYSDVFKNPRMGKDGKVIVKNSHTNWVWSPSLRVVGLSHAVEAIIRQYTKPTSTEKYLDEIVYENNYKEDDNIFNEWEKLQDDRREAAQISGQELAFDGPTILLIAKTFRSPNPPKYVIMTKGNKKTKVIDKASIDKEFKRVLDETVVGREKREKTLVDKLKTRVASNHDNINNKGKDRLYFKLEGKGKTFSAAVASKTIKKPEFQKINLNFIFINSKGEEVKDEFPVFASSIKDVERFLKDHPEVVKYVGGQDQVENATKKLRKDLENQE